MLRLIISLTLESRLTCRRGKGGFMAIYRRLVYASYVPCDNYYVVTGREDLSSLAVINVA